VAKYLTIHFIDYWLKHQQILFVCCIFTSN